jgi:hypothetical protein
MVQLWPVKNFSAVLDLRELRTIKNLKGVRHIRKLRISRQCVGLISRNAYQQDISWDDLQILSTVVRWPQLGVACHAGGHGSDSQPCDIAAFVGSDRYCHV